MLAGRGVELFQERSGVWHEGEDEGREGNVGDGGVDLLPGARDRFHVCRAHLLGVAPQDRQHRLAGIDRRDMADVRRQGQGEAAGAGADVDGRAVRGIGHTAQAVQKGIALQVHARHAGCVAIGPAVPEGTAERPEAGRQPLSFLEAVGDKPAPSLCSGVVRARHRGIVAAWRSEAASTGRVAARRGKFGRALNAVSSQPKPLELDLGSETIGGRLEGPDGPLDFSGWLGLASALEQLLVSATLRRR